MFCNRLDHVLVLTTFYVYAETPVREVDYVFWASLHLHISATRRNLHASDIGLVGSIVVLWSYRKLQLEAIFRI
jgi:hypothetical protein